MNRLDKQVCEAVDRLLLELGAYAPVELLLVEGQLLYSDFETWREGRLDYLEEALFGDPAHGDELMKRAAAYAGALGLESEILDYRGWGESRGRPLRFSPDPKRDGRFHTGYRKPPGTAQMDLLMDTPGVALANGIVQALADRNHAEARRLLDRLSSTEAGHRQLAGLEKLVAAAARTAPIADAHAELRWLEEELEPLAVEIMGAAARHFLVPQWRRLAGALGGRRFDPNAPRLHRSYPALMAQDWGEAVESIEAEPGWRNDPALLRRHARACERLRRDMEALVDWFGLCWTFPEQAVCIASEGGPEWRRRWQRFSDLDPVLQDRDFPAWVLLTEPGLARRLRQEKRPGGPTMPEDCRLVAELAVLPPAELVDNTVIDTRKKLKALNPPLFAHHLKRRDGPT